jgi:hypothetical protein
MMARSEGADGIRRAGISSQQKCLATASAEVFRATITATARFRHPLLSAKSLESGGLSPYPFERILAHIIKAHSWNHARRMTGKRLPRGID